MLSHRYRIWPGIDAPRTISFIHVGSANTSRTYSGRWRGSISRAMHIGKNYLRTKDKHGRMEGIVVSQTCLSTRNFSHAYVASATRNADCPTILYRTDARSRSYLCQAFEVRSQPHPLCLQRYGSPKLHNNRAEQELSLCSFLT